MEHRGGPGQTGQEADEEIYFYVGSYAASEAEGIHLCTLDGVTGEMKRLQSVAGVENPSYLALDREGRFLYAASEREEGEVHAFAVEPRNRSLLYIGSQRTGGASPCYVSVSEEGDYVLVANYSGGDVNAFPVNRDGSLGEMTGRSVHKGRSVRDDRQEAPHPHSIVPAGKGRVLVCDLGLDRISLYRLEDGQFAGHSDVQLPPGSGPRHLVRHPWGEWAYAVNELSHTVTAFAYDEEKAELRTLGHTGTLPANYAAGSDDTAAAIHISPCGTFLYVSNRGHDSIALFRIDGESGMPEAVDWQMSGGKTPRGFALVGGMLLAANQTSGNVVSFTIDRETGRLIPTGHALDIQSPVCVAGL